MARTRFRRRYAKNPERSQALANPPLLTDLAEFVGPGFASFAVTRLATRVAATQVAQRKPEWGKHAGAVVSVGAFLSAWFLAHRIKWISRWHTPVTVGAAIAALQSLIQLYFPKLGWMVADASPELDSATTAQLAAAQAPVPANLSPTNDDPNEYTYNDEYDPGRYGQTHQIQGQPARASKVAPMPPTPRVDSSNDGAIDDAIGDLGVFNN